MMITLDPNSLSPCELTFARHIGVSLEKGGYRLTSQPGDRLSVACTDNVIHIDYAKKCELFRGIALLKEDLAPGEAINQPARFDSMAAFCDCSRNAVMNVDMVKRLIMDIAALGYDQLQLYTEDTFEIPEYPYFGHYRGRYSAEEIRELDRFAAEYGVELVPAVQTLAHLRTIFRWPQFDSVHDTGDILLCGSEDTYQFLDRMLAATRAMYSTDKINIGMDEAHMLGLGKYLDENGYTDKMDIFLQHIKRVVDLVRKHGFKPMMWSDMFFKIACGQCNYNELTAVSFDEDVLSLIPEDLSLVYWNYCATEVEHYDTLFQAHKAMGREVLFAGGFRKWAGFCPTLQDSFDASRAALTGVVNQGIRKVIMTAWSDDGAEGAMNLILPGLTLYAEMNYVGDMSDETIDHRLRTLFGYSLADFRLLEQPFNVPEGQAPGERIPVNSNVKMLLWNDPLLGMYDRHVIPGCQEHYRQTAAQLATAAAADNRFSYMFETVGALCHTLELKAELGVRLRTAYQKGDIPALQVLCENDIPELLCRLDAFQHTFRRNWQVENKIFGFDVQDIRFGALRARLTYTQEVLAQYLAGQVDSIPELAEASLYADCRPEDSDKPLHLSTGLLWTQMVTACVL